jgi:hypothetical protein
MPEGKLLKEERYALVCGDDGDDGGGEMMVIMMAMMMVMTLCSL